jgi:NADH:ubiquinone oxidoreductase subunit 5 (subunit L)/multisubunit Na+/H+ antiporter MnhA subunit
MASWLASSFDPQVIDGAVNDVANGIWSVSSRWRALQTGYVQHYLFAFLAGALIIVGYYALG